MCERAPVGVVYMSSLVQKSFNFFLIWRIYSNLSSRKSSVKQDYLYVEIKGQLDATEWFLL
jgi:hypothetical protein